MGVSADFPIRRIDHLEFYVGNAKQAAVYYNSVFGFTTTAYRGLETVSRDTASYLVEQGDIRLLLTTALCAGHPIAKHVREHGDGVAIIALQVPDAAQAFHETVRRGASPAIEPTEEKDENGVLRYSAIHCYGETLLKFVERDDYVGGFAPGFQARLGSDPRAVRSGDLTPGLTAGAGLTAIDHIVGNVELGGMERWVRFFEETMGFTQLVH